MSTMGEKKDRSRSVLLRKKWGTIVSLKPSVIIGVEDGVMWADSTRDLTESSKTGDCPNDYLPYLVENEVPIGV